ncbi:hypothetical protein Syun_012284 [Stephania yunnanensis]|uniref:Uncharacterized protein n=1 Tax=Stephania yunnanensis TaxID=152371 RepID=A0AAP0PHD4_9MAGN
MPSPKALSMFQYIQCVHVDPRGVHVDTVGSLLGCGDSAFAKRYRRALIFFFFFRDETDAENLCVGFARDAGGGDRGRGRRGHGITSNHVTIHDRSLALYKEGTGSSGKRKLGECIRVAAAEDVAAAEEGRRELSRPESGQTQGSREVRGKGEARRRGSLDDHCWAVSRQGSSGRRGAPAAVHQSVIGGEGGGPVKEEEVGTGGNHKFLLLKYVFLVCLV